VSDEQRRDEDRKRAIESPFRGLGGQPKSVRDVIKTADEMFLRYEGRLENQRKSINSLLAHHNRAHPECNFDDGPGNEPSDNGHGEEEKA